MQSRYRLSARRNSPARPTSWGSSSSRHTPSIRTPISVPPRRSNAAMQPPRKGTTPNLDILYPSVHNVNEGSKLTIACEDTAADRRMARPREFDEVTALEAAIDCFWRHGYEETSVRALAAKMGISAPSLYNTYGHKHALFVQALERYLDHSTRARIKRLEDSLPPKQAIRRFIEEIIERSVNDRERRGCFLIYSAPEVAPPHKELRAPIADPLSLVQALFPRSIRAAATRG